MEVLTTSRLANVAARRIYGAFVDYLDGFQIITARARDRFEERAWGALQADGAERLDLYRTIVEACVADLRKILGDREQEKLVWASIKAVYSGLIDEHPSCELGETFFNSITRKVFVTVGVDEQVEFVATDFDHPPTGDHAPAYRTYNRAPSTAELIRRILDDQPFAVPYLDLDRDVGRVAGRVERQLREAGALKVVERAEILRSVFYRNKAAYVIGRLISGPHTVPIVLALLNGEEGMEIDAALLDESDLSILFSFTRNHFHVEMDSPHDLVRFLQTLMPRKRSAEIYIAIGHHKHGKTMLFREMLLHLSTSDDRFEIARGERGLVMSVFTLQGFDMVFKVIKDDFGPTKSISRSEVMNRYQLVFRHDRAGRLVDAQEFEHLEFDRERFSEELLQELGAVAGQSVEIHDDRVVVRHAYVERRLIPLNLFVHEADDAAAEAAVVDYGYAIKDLAASNVFPGDLLLKNFGVTRHGRVVFYDYDELTFLTACNFRRMPPPRDYDDEMAGEPWFSVGKDDVFPEEFVSFLGLTGRLRELFLEHHSDIFTAELWQRRQEEQRSGVVTNILPYWPSRQFEPRADGDSS